MDVLLETLTESDRRDPAWLKTEAFLTARLSRLTRKLITSNDEEVRGRIKEIEFLLTPPGVTHTAL